jgi:hypothetical protein
MEVGSWKIGEQTSNIEGRGFGLVPFFIAGVLAHFTYAEKLTVMF